MKNYKVKYNGNSTRFRNFEQDVSANSEREAVEAVYMQFLDANYFPDETGTIRDCNGNIVAEPNDNVIEYDGGNFFADEIKE